LSDPFVGEIRLFGFNFAPVGWAMCQGQLLPISQNTALFSLLGTTYGGNGTSTFALPDLRGRVPVSQGQGLGLSPYSLGEIEGTETVTLSATQLPAHNHLVRANDNKGTMKTAAGNVLALGKKDEFATAPDATTVMNSAMIESAGDDAPINNLQPLLVLNACIALNGIYPSRS
jgi:microcystin-dependent protein